MIGFLRFRNHSETPDLLKAAVFGANDGIVTTFAVVAGVVGAHLSPKVILIMGVSNLVADGLAMGLGDYLGELSRQEARSKGRTPGGIWHTGLATFLAFLTAGTAPLLPYLWQAVGQKLNTDSPFFWSVVATGATLFFVGALRANFTRRGWLRSGLEMLTIGAIAAGAAFGLGAGADRLLR